MREATGRYLVRGVWLDGFSMRRGEDEGSEDLK